MSLLSQQLIESRWLKMLVMLLVLSGLAWQLSIAIWSVVPVSEQMQRPAPIANSINRNSTATAIDYPAQALEISSAFLFGKVEPKVVEVVTEAPVTTLNYKLRGIFYAEDDGESSAIIEIKANDSQYYRINDELAENILLAAIESDHILIDRYGKLERLDLEKKLAGDAANNQTAATRPAAGAANHVAILRSYKRRYASNPMALANRFQAIPVQENGANVGFRLQPLRGESLLSKLDFQKNDVFTSVNGANLANPFEALDALRSLTTADSVTVTFLRNGVPQTRDFRL